MPRFGQPITYPTYFESWWNTHSNLFRHELIRRHAALKLRDRNYNVDQAKEDLKTDVYREVFLGVSADVPRRQANLLDNAIIAGRRNSFIGNIINNGYDQADFKFDNKSIVSARSAKYSNPNLIFNEDDIFMKYYASSKELTDLEIRMTLLKTYMMIANMAEDRKIEEGAVLSLVYVGEQGIYVLNVGDCPVYLTLFDDINPSQDQTKLIARIHDVNDSFEKGHAIKRGGVFDLYAKRGDLRLSGVRFLRRIGGFVDNSYDLDRPDSSRFIPGISILPSLSYTPFKQPNGDVLNLKNMHITLCSDGVSKVYSTTDITKIARWARDNDTHNISTAVVNHGGKFSRDDVTAVDVNLTPGILACVIDGHGVPNKAYKNPAVDLFKSNLDRVFTQELISVKSAFNNNNTASKQDGITLFAGTCANQESGCYTAAYSIYREMNTDNSIYLRYVGGGPYGASGYINAENGIKKFSNVNSIVLSGCLIIPEHIDSILDSFVQYDLNIENIIDITYILMPHHSQKYSDKNALDLFSLNCMDKLFDSYESGLNPNLKINYLCSSFIYKHEYCIGFPSLINTAGDGANEILIHQDSCGLVYLGAHLEKETLYKIFEKIFKHINMTKGAVIAPVVYCYGEPKDLSDQNLLMKLAENYNITLLFQPRAPAHEFQQKLWQLSEINKYPGRHVTVFCDGTSTLIESIALSLNVLIARHFSIPNANLYAEFVLNSPAEHKEIMERMFGFFDFDYNEKNINLIEEVKVRLKEAIKPLKVILKNAENVFNAYKLSNSSLKRKFKECERDRACKNMLLNAWQGKSSNAKTYTAKHDGNTLVFEEKTVAGDGNCAFTASGFDKSNLVKTLLELSNNSDVRRKFAPEIQSHFLTMDANKKPHLHNGAHLAWLDAIIKSLEKYMLAQASLDSLKREVISKYQALNLDNLSLADSISALPQSNEDRAQLVSLDKASNEAHHEFNLLCEREEVYKYYVSLFAQEGWGSIQALMHYARATKINLCIWQNSGHGNDLTLVESSDNAINDLTKNIIFKFTHFDSLECISIDSMKATKKPHLPRERL